MDEVSDWACQGFTFLAAGGIVTEMATAICRLMAGGYPLSKNPANFSRYLSPSVMTTLVLCLRALPAFAQLDTIPFRVVDVDKAVPVEVVLPNGATARVELLDRTEKADTVRGAVRVELHVNGGLALLEA